MRKLAFVAGIVVILASFPMTIAHAQEEKPTVRGYLFYSQECSACRQVRSQVMPKLYQQFGQQLQIMAIEISADDANYQWLLACEQKYGVSPEEAGIPVLFIGDQYLIGVPAIESQLPDLFQEYVSKGGVDYPDVPRPGGPLQPQVHFMFFYSPTCPHCLAVEEQVFPNIQEKFGSQVQWDAYSISDETNYRALLVLGDTFQLPPDMRGVVPVIFVGDGFSLYSMLIGSVQIEAYLEPAIEWYLAVGGVGSPDWKDQLFELAATPFPEPTAAVTIEPTPSPAPQTPTSEVPSTAGPAIHMAYFAERGCSECDRVSIALERLQEQFPNLVIQKFDIIDDLSTNLCLCKALGVPESQRHDAPAVFVGTDYLVGQDVQYEQLIQLVSKYRESGAVPSWQTCVESQVELPPPPPWWAVILPGLGDGINPCAFATMIFFVSYLSLVGRKGREILLVGASFTLAVFLSYLSFGIVLREILAGLIDWTGPILRPILNGITAGLCLLLAVLSFVDFRQARQGNVEDMTLRLPDRLRRWINATIRQSMKARTFIVASFVAGVVVSFIELACTGQVYVPIILGLSNPGYRAQSMLALTVYCVAFIVPLAIVFTISYMGTSSQQLGALLRRYTANVKLITALLFLAIGIWLIYDTLRVWGIFMPLSTAAHF
jgi:cytochrome c biogenesis protein CcdA/thiol-disulfide isomerase/thioredoxin